MQERRRHQRGRTFLGGQVAFGQRYCIFDCLVRNLSQRGARLVFSAHALVPDEFDLAIPHRGDSRRARVIWRREADVGVEFLAYELAKNQDRPSLETVRRIAALKQQNAALARRVAELNESAY